MSVQVEKRRRFDGKYNTSAADGWYRPPVREGFRHIFVSEKCTIANICQRFAEECLRLIFRACAVKAEFNRSRFRKAGKMACDFSVTLSLLRIIVWNLFILLMGSFICDLFLCLWCVCCKFYQRLSCLNTAVRINHWLYVSCWIFY